jgi:NAD(P)-dependent dehydrogenase (short-subunit alcohol dehydrogenase family)
MDWYVTPVSLEIDLHGKVVLVTGGTKGVGRGIAGRFADAGATVAVCARKEVDDLPADWTFLSADIRDGEVAFAMVDSVVERLGRVDVLVNNAGGSPPADTTDAAPRFTERIVQLNLLSTIYCAQRANHWMQQGDGGSIVNITSVSGMRPTPKTAAYGAAKAGIVNFTITTAVEWAPKVRVNCVTAGMVRTEQAHLFYGDEDGIAAVGATVPLGRIANPSDIGDACVFLASDLAGYVSGANLAVHGGGEPPPYLDVAAI